MREVVIDTETTGLDASDGHRIVEIACVELLDHIRTGRKWQRYLNPERDVPEEALRVHGLTTQLLSGYALFSDVADEFLAFVRGDQLVTHNAEFDLGFINAELIRSHRPAISGDYVDTLALARQRFPGAPASLDALCRRFGIDLSARERHGAEIDCELLALVYLELIGGRQPGLELIQPIDAVMPAVRSIRTARPHAPSDDELAAHNAMLQSLAKPLWLIEA
jgi:DNA polymerase-3 subunit epsilon